MPRIHFPAIPASAWYAGALTALSVWAVLTFLPWYLAVLAVAGVACYLHQRNPGWLDSGKHRARALLQEPRVRHGLACLALAAITILIWYLSQRDLPDAIPAVRVAEAKMRTIETARDGVTDSLKWLTDGIDQAQLSGDDEASSLTEIVSQARELLKLAEDMPKRLDDLKSRQAEYQQQMIGADEVFRQAASTWRGYAVEASPGGIREMYVSLSKLWDSYASAIQASKDQPLDLRELEVALVYVDEARLLLSRLIAHVDNLPPVDAMDKQRQLEHSVRLFIKKFDKLRSSIDSLSEEIEETGNHSRIAFHIDSTAVANTPNSHRPKPKAKEHTKPPEESDSLISPDEDVSASLVNADAEEHAVSERKLERLSEARSTRDYFLDNEADETEEQAHANSDGISSRDESNEVASAGREAHIDPSIPVEIVAPHKSSRPRHHSPRSEELVAMQASEDRFLNDASSDRTDQQSGPDDAIRPLSYEDEDDAQATAIGRLERVDQLNPYGDRSVFRSDDEPVREADVRRSEVQYLPASDGYREESTGVHLRQVRTLPPISTRADATGYRTLPPINSNGWRVARPRYPQPYDSYRSQRNGNDYDGWRQSQR